MSYKLSLLVFFFRSSHVTSVRLPSRLRMRVISCIISSTHLKYAVLVAHSDVVDVDKFAVKLQPKIGLALLALAKGVDNLRHASYALAQVAVFHVAPDDARTSRKYTALRIGVKFHDLALIDEREIDGHMAKNEVDLLWRELARGNVQDFVLCGFSLV